MLDFFSHWGTYFLLLGSKNGFGFFCKSGSRLNCFCNLLGIGGFPSSSFCTSWEDCRVLGGMLMVIFKVITADQAYAAIDLQILGLLFGTMVVSVYLERADMFKYLGKLLSWKSRGAKDLICRVCLISAISSAFFTNDTTCVVLTEFVLKIARQHNLPPHPFLLALASSANIGSAATPIGNPQNLVITV